MSRRAVFASVVLGCAVSGCGYFGFESQDVAPVVVPDASVDASSDAGTPLDCAARPTALVCSTFDSFAGFGTTYPPQSGSVAVADGVLRAETTDLGGTAIVDADFAPLTAGTLYLRARVRLVGSYPIVDINSFQLGDRGSTNDYGTDLDFVAGGHVQVNQNGAATGTTRSATALPRDTWVCLDSVIVIGEAGSIDLRIDGTPAIAATNVDTLPTNGVRQLLLGIEWTNASQPNAVVEYDEFVVDTVPIACP